MIFKVNSKRCWFVIAGVLLAFFLIWFFCSTITFEDPWSLIVTDKYGELVGAKIASDGQWRFPACDTVPKKFEKAIIEAEDRRFYYHSGVDPIALLRATRQNLRAKRRVSGGSTIDMQTVRLSRKGKPRTFIQKSIEIVLALQLRITHKKSSILALYASHAPFGGNVVGLETAAWRYFGHSPKALSWAESATLAVLPNSPSLIHPGRNRAKLKVKRDNLLRKLHDKKIISEMELIISLREPLLPRPQLLPQIAPHLVDRIWLSGHTKPVQSKIHTSLDVNLQKGVMEILQRRMIKLSANGIMQSAALVLDVKSGKALVYAVHSATNAEAKDVDVITAPRSTGSVLKPLLYAAMLDNGDITPSTLIPDVPINIGGFTPRNFNREYEGAVPAEKALARSLNVPAVSMVRQFGVHKFWHLLRDLGMTTITRSADNYGISIILGGVEGSLWELTGVYAGLARSVTESSTGYFNPCYLFESTKELTGSSMPISKGAAYCALMAMDEVIRPGEEGAWKEFASSRRMAWKTGTSFGFRDGWAIGCTPEYAIGVWVGNASGAGRPMLIGIETAAPILFDILRIVPQTTWFRKPEISLAEISVCAKSGYRPGPYCETVKPLFAPEAVQRVPPCPYHRLLHLNSYGTAQVNSSCYSINKIISIPWFILPPVIEHYYCKTHSDYKSPPPMHSGCIRTTTKGNIGIIYPSPNAVIVIPKEIGGESGKAIFKTSHRNSEEKIYWHIDGDFIGTTHRVHEIATAPLSGTHTLLVIDSKGEQAECIFSVP